MVTPKPDKKTVESYWKNGFYFQKASDEKLIASICFEKQDHRLLAFRLILENISSDTFHLSPKDLFGTITNENVHPTTSQQVFPFSPEEVFKEIERKNGYERKNQLVAEFLTEALFEGIWRAAGVELTAEQVAERKEHDRQENLNRQRIRYQKIAEMKGAYGRQVLKQNTLFPGEKYSGLVCFTAPKEGTKLTIHLNEGITGTPFAFDFRLMKVY